MRNPMFPLIPALLLLPLLTLAPTLAAQEASAWTIRVAALDIGDTGDTLWLRSGDGVEPVQVRLNTRIFSPPIRIESPATLRFHASENAAVAEDSPAPLASVRLTSPSSLLVFSPRRERDGYDIHATADGDFPFGSFRLVNFSRATVRAEFGARTVMLAYGDAETVSFRGSQNITPVRIHALTAESTPRLIRQTSWSVIPTQRELILFLPNPETGLVRLRHFVDTRVQDPDR